MLTESEPHYRQPLLKTPFHERARALSQLDSFVPWAGYTTVDVFTSVEQEYFAIRNASSLYDLTPMVKYRIAGPDALRFLNRLVTRDIRKLAPGKVAYTVWCNDEGHLIDDGTVFCIAPNEYRICTAERQLDWFRASAIGFDVEIREVTEEVAALAVQGPTSCKLLKAVGLAGIERLKPFEHAEFSMPRSGGAGQIAMMVSRTGFTGDLGYELWMQPADAEARVGCADGGGQHAARCDRSARAPSTWRASRRDSCCRTWISSPPSTPCTWAPSARRWSSDLPGWWISARDISPAAARCSRSSARGPRRQLVGLDVEGTKPAHNALLYHRALRQEERRAA